jgi:large subunit ribosomal protein L32
MALPKYKLSKSRGRKRRTHWIIKAPTLVRCSQCDEPKLPHHVCPNCGTYRGRQVIEVSD